MLPTAEEAAQALRDIDLIKHRAAGFQDYRAESGQLILWGLAYLAGFSLSACFPRYLLGIWTAVVLAALAIGTWLAVRSGAGAGIVRRYLAVITTILSFIIAVHWVFWPISPEQGAMLAPLFLSALYVLRGIQLRPRYTVIGAALGILSLGGYLFLLPVFWPWMAMACGGTLILSGLWLRSH
ncbi:hypothetical protein [Halopseudomonas pertucinogena]|uniref:DUF4401 domain-containing protein n=1 Tax=Halopseudomonas pertucinogena TaxID=86175 RepID=A0ABQ2CNC3_9GAMM|nr:hypothetical protein [Halopseudomonas pertucinogena]GGI95791.1 hypothetical protein GCM10009083_10400 [Halopseudomonas pertucinogena]